MWQRLKPIAFHPFSVLAVSIGLALIFALLISLRYDGETRFNYLYYNIPISVPFIAFLFDRVSRWNVTDENRWLLFIDLPILVLALMRAKLPIPFVSGHALFLSYAILTTQSWVARLTAVLVLIEVFCLKIFLWHDITLIGGVLLGMSAAFIRRWFDPRKFRVIR